MASPKKPSQKVTDVLDQLSHTDDGVFAVDLAHRIILWNRTAEGLLGYSAEEVLGRRCHEVVRGRDSTGKRICSKRCRRFGEARKRRWVPAQNIQTCTKSGENIWINVSTLAVLSSQNELSSIVHTFRPSEEFKTSPDGHDRVQIQKQLPQPPPAIGSVHDVAGMAGLTLLSSREFMVLRHLAEGLDTKMIGERLAISPNTVRNHVQSIIRKLQVHSRLEAVSAALHHRPL